jgi:hypothetical protein
VELVEGAESGVDEKQEGRGHGLSWGGQTTEEEVVRVQRAGGVHDAAASVGGQAGDTSEEDLGCWGTADALRVEHQKVESFDEDVETLGDARVIGAMLDDVFVDLCVERG